jgi:hypothetical protein
LNKEAFWWVYASQSSFSGWTYGSL